MTNVLTSSLLFALLLCSVSRIDAQTGYSPCSALPIDTVDCFAVDNSLAPGSGFQPGCGDYQGHDLWLAMVVPPSGSIVVNTAGNGGLDDSVLSLWTGPGCAGIGLIGCDDDSGDLYHARYLSSGLVPGDSLWIQVFGYGNGVGTFEVCVSAIAPVSLINSELPIVEINTLGQYMTTGPKIDALMEITYNDAGNLTSPSDVPNVYSGAIGIEVRGASSSGYLQRPFGFETRDSIGENLNVSILGMPEENDWVLLSNFNDRSLLKNQLSFWISQGMGQYAPRTHLCEVMINNDYQGIYVFGEKIKPDAGRVDIAKLTPLENSGDDLTGGYIIGQDLWSFTNSFESNYSPIDHPALDVRFVYRYPDEFDITNEQRTYIASYVDSLETALYAPNFNDLQIGYRNYLDVKSFIDYFIVNEVARNGDGFKKSVYFHKDKDSNDRKLKAGPVWDFDWAWKNIYECTIVSATDGSGWAHQVNNCPTDNNSCGWYVRMLEDELFRNELQCAYQNYRTTMLDTAMMFHYIDSVVARVENAQARHFSKWPILGVSGPAPDVGPVPTTYVDEITAFKAWITLRLDWLDANLPGLCQSISVAENSTIGPLMFHPNPSNGSVTISGSIPDDGSGRLEFYDVAGRTIAELRVGSGRVMLEHALPGSGTYFYKVFGTTGIVQTGKLIVL